MPAENPSKFVLLPTGIPPDDIPKIHRIYGDTNGMVHLPRWEREQLQYRKFGGLDRAIRGTRHIRTNTNQRMEAQLAELAKADDVQYSFRKLMDLTDKGQNTFAKYAFVEWLLQQTRNTTRGGLQEAGARFELLARRPEFNSFGSLRQRDRALKDVSEITGFMEQRAKVLPYLPTVRQTQKIMWTANSKDICFSEWLYGGDWKGAAGVLRVAEDQIQDCLHEHADPNLCCPSD
jgi:hypothetical protein